VAGEAGVSRVGELLVDDGLAAITGYLVSGLKYDRARGPNITQRLRFTLRRPSGECFSSASRPVI
jgi:hypothetical protein